MKKLITFLMLIFCFGLQAQTFTPQKADIKNPSKYTHQAVGDTVAQMVYIINAAGDTLGVVSVLFTQAQIDSLQKSVQQGTWTVGLNFTQAQLDSLQKATWSALWASAANQVITNGHLTDIRGSDSTLVANGVKSISYSLPSYTTFTAGIAADTLSGTSVACAKITLMNASAGKILYYGFDGSITTANGQGALGYLDTATLYVTNLNKVYLISDSATTDVRVTYYNY